MKYVGEELYKKINFLIHLPDTCQRALQARTIIAQDYQENPHYLSIRRKRENNLLLLTVAFNNFDAIKTQYTYLKRNILDPFTYVVVDNSSRSLVAKKLYCFCKQQDITYLQLKGNPYNEIDGSKSHGLALNWAYDQYIKTDLPTYFGVIDHDIFPLKQTSIIKNLKSLPFYGQPQSRKNIWYLWPGYCFFNLKRLQAFNPDFSPRYGADAGSGNWSTIYKNYNQGDFPWPFHDYLVIDGGKGEVVELIDDWIHVIAGSGWNNHGKVKKISLIIDTVASKWHDIYPNGHTFAAYLSRK